MFIVGLEDGRHCGCRILSEIALGNVTFRIHGGAMPADAGRDEPAQFMLTGEALDVLIDHLKDLRRQAAESAAQPTPKRETVDA